MDNPVFNLETQRWEFMMFVRLESYATKELALSAIQSHYNWMFEDTDYGSYEEN